MQSIFLLTLPVVHLDFAGDVGALLRHLDLLLHGVFQGYTEIFRLLEDGERKRDVHFLPAVSALNLVHGIQTTDMQQVWAWILIHFHAAEDRLHQGHY